MSIGTLEIGSTFFEKCQLEILPSAHKCVCACSCSWMFGQSLTLEGCLYIHLLKRETFSLLTQNLEFKVGTYEQGSVTERQPLFYSYTHSHLDSVQYSTTSVWNAGSKGRESAAFSFSRFIMPENICNINENDQNGQGWNLHELIFFWYCCFGHLVAAKQVKNLTLI